MTENAAPTQPMTPFTYQIAAPGSWTDEEQRRLEQTLDQYPGADYSIVSQCAKIAARLPNKSIRDVGASRPRRNGIGRVPSDGERPPKSLSSLGARLRALALDPQGGTGSASGERPSSEAHEALNRRASAVLLENVAVIGDMRENLQKINLLDNIPLMQKFNDNVTATFALLDALDAKTPPFPVEVNTMFLGQAAEQAAAGGPMSPA